MNQFNDLTIKRFSASTSTYPARSNPICAPRLEAQFRSAQTAFADAVLFSVLGAVQDFAAASPLVDDMSLVVVSNRSLQNEKEQNIH